MLVPASLAALGLLTLVPGSTNQLKVHELRSTDTKTVCDLRTAVFSSDLQGAYTKILQGRKWEESMQEKTKVLVARASSVPGAGGNPTTRVECAGGRTGSVRFVYTM